ncbi:MAG: hypothetical protein ABF586_09265 [Sporolactobacillus sp.]
MMKTRTHQAREIRDDEKVGRLLDGQPGSWMHQRPLPELIDAEEETADGKALFQEDR